jgi:hypothetical protein
MPHLPQPETKPRTFLQRYGLRLFLATAVFFFILAQIIRLLTPPAPPVSQNNTWQTVTPGITTRSEVEARLGQPINSIPTANGTELQYKSVYPALPQQVIVDKDQKVQFIKEFIDYDPKNTIDSLLAQYGSADMEMFDPATGNGSTALVFLKQGVVVVINRFSKVIEQKWYFVPSSKEEFLQNAGKTLQAEEAGPEPAQ